MAKKGLVEMDFITGFIQRQAMGGGERAIKNNLHLLSE